MGWFKQKKFISSQFWRLDVLNQSVNMVVSSEASPWLIDSIFSRGLSSVCVCFLISSCDTCHIGLGPVHMNSFLPSLPLRKFCLHKQSHSEILEVRTSAYSFRGDTVQTLATNIVLVLFLMYVFF